MFIIRCDVIVSGESLFGSLRPICCLESNFAIFAISELLSGREDKIENITIAVRPTKILQKKEEWMREKGYGTHKI